MKKQIKIIINEFIPQKQAEIMNAYIVDLENNSRSIKSASKEIDELMIKFKRLQSENITLNEEVDSLRGELAEHLALEERERRVQGFENRLELNMLNAEFSAETRLNEKLMEAIKSIFPTHGRCSCGESCQEAKN